MKRLAAVMAMILIISVVLPLHAFAVPYNTEMYKSYNYNSEGWDVDCPAAYVPSFVLSSKDFGLDVMAPNDIFVDKDRNIYIVDTKNSIVFIMNEQFQLTGRIQSITGGEDTDTLKNPEGVFVSSKGEIYIADTGNQRIIVVDKNGKVQRKFPAPEISVMKDATSYMPRKIVVDRAGRMYVVSRNINRGLIELDATGKFIGFMGAPKVVPNMVEHLWKKFSTDEQKRRMTKFVPTEYNNVCINSQGFIYATIGTLDFMSLLSTILSRDMSGNVTPIKKLNPTGTDVLRRRGFFPPVGDISFSREGSSSMIDVAVDENGMYSLLDSRYGRVFTYDMDGNLLYIFGGIGSQVGKFQSVSSIEYIGDKIIVADQGSGNITVFDITPYGKCIKEAVDLSYRGKYDEALEKWKHALKYNSNLYMAYVGIGKVELRKENYKSAMRYLKVANEKIYYSKAFRMYRKETLYYWFSVIGILILVIFALFVVNRVIKIRISKTARKRLV